MATEGHERITYIKVGFQEEEFALLLKRVADWLPGAEAKYIHDVVVKNLQRWAKREKAKKEETHQ